MRPSDDLINEFIAAPKRGSRYRWIRANHPDFAEARIFTRVDNRPDLDGFASLLACKFQDPPKYSFALIFKGIRVLALDVAPRRFHRNILTGRSVSGTHWHRWPKISEAVSDDRDLIHRIWFYEFARAANISYPYRYRQPPSGEQLTLSLDVDIG